MFSSYSASPNIPAPSSRVLFTLHPGAGAPLEPLEFDGETVTLADNTRMDLSKQLKVG